MPGNRVPASGIGLVISQYHRNGVLRALCKRPASGLLKDLMSGEKAGTD